MRMIQGLRGVAAEREMARCREIRAHVSEPFWYIYVMYRTPEGQQCTFSWRRGHIYDHVIATVLYENCVDSPKARIAKVGIQAH